MTDDDVLRLAREIADAYRNGDAPPARKRRPMRRNAPPRRGGREDAVVLGDVLGAQWPATVLAAGAVISIFSVTLVTLFGQSRILYAIGRDGLLPRPFSRVAPHTHTPVFSTVTAAVVVALLAGLIPLSNLWDMVSMGTLVAFIVVSIAVMVLRRTRPDLPRAFRVPGYPVTPILSTTPRFIASTCPRDLTGGTYAKRRSTSAPHSRTPCARSSARIPTRSIASLAPPTGATARC